MDWGFNFNVQNFGFDLFKNQICVRRSTVKLRTNRIKLGGVSEKLPSRLTSNNLAHLLHPLCHLLAGKWANFHVQEDQTQDEDGVLNLDHGYEEHNISMDLWGYHGYPWIELVPSFSKDRRWIVYDWFRKPFWSYSLSAPWQYPSLTFDWLHNCLDKNLAKINYYWSLTKFILTQHNDVYEFNSTGRWAAKLTRETGKRIVTKRTKKTQSRIHGFYSVSHSRMGVSRYLGVTYNTMMKQSTYLWKFFPSTRTTIQQLGRQTSCASKSRTYSNLLFAIPDVVDNARLEINARAKTTQHSDTAFINNRGAPKTSMKTCELDNTGKNKTNWTTRTTLYWRNTRIVGYNHRL